MRQVVVAGALLLAACAHGDAPPASAGPVRLDLIAINDFHGNLEAPRGGLEVAGGRRVDAGGVARLAAHVAALRARAEHSLVVSAGDLIGASPLLSALFHDEPTIEAMDALGLDINGVGNHEFDEGPEELLRMKAGGCHPEDGCAGRPAFAGARFEFLAANVFARESGETIFPAVSVRDVGGIDVGFIGLTLEDTPGMLPPVVDGFDFRDEAETANAHVAELKARGVRAIVVLLHEGGFQKARDPNACDALSGPVVDVVRRFDPEIDVVLSGHTHQAYVCEMEGRLLTSAGSFGRMLTHVQLELDPGTGDVVRARAENRVVDHELAPDPEVEATVARYRTMAAPLADRVVTRMRGSLTRARTAGGVSSLGRVIADAQLEATRARGAEVAFMNSGGIRAAVAPVLDAEGLGDVTYGMLFSAQPFNNLLVTMSLKGAQLLEVLGAQFRSERPRFLDASSNLAYRWRRVYEEGRRPDALVIPESVRISGAPLELERIYRVTVNAYMAGKGVFAEGTDRVNGPVDLEALVAYLEAHDPFEAPNLRGVELASRP